MLKPGSKCEKIFCPTLNHIREFLEKTCVITNPQVILIHCGTNCLYGRSVDVEKFQNDFVEVMACVRSYFASAKIVVSSLLPRGERHINEIIGNLNDFINGCCNTFDKFHFMNNINIKRYMLEDNKHLNYKGFRILCSNIRFTLFGM